MFLFHIKIRCFILGVKEVRRIKRLSAIEEKFNKVVPPIIGELNAILESEDVSIGQVAEIIKKDLILTSKVLRLANAPFYGFPGRIGSVEDALMILGLNTIKIIVYTMCIVDMMNTHYADLREHSVRVAEKAKALAENLDIPKVGEVYTAALLHDFGKVAIKLTDPDYEELKKEAKIKKIPLWQLEERELGINHTEIAANFLREWMFPERIIEMVEFHHEVEKSKNYLKETALIHLVDALNNVQWSTKELKNFPGFSNKTFQILEIDPEKLDLLQ